MVKPAQTGLNAARSATTHEIADLKNHIKEIVMALLKFQLIDSYGDWLRRLHREKRIIWFVTLQFRDQKLPSAQFVDLMENQVQRIYATLLTRVVRKPRRAMVAQLPVLIGFPDSPVAKRASTALLNEVRPNSGMHYHFLIGMPPKTRLAAPLDEHIRASETHYKGTLISTIHVTAVNDVNGRIADYVFKHLKRRTYTRDDILILPRERSELPLQLSASTPRARVAPHELRTAFLQLVQEREKSLLAGRTVQLYTNGPAPSLLLAIMPITNLVNHGVRQGRPLKGGKRGVSKLQLTVHAVHLVIPEVGQQTTRTGTPKQVLRDLKAVFSEIVLRAPQFQRTPTFADFAEKLAPLCMRTYEVVLSKPISIPAGRAKRRAPFGDSSAF